MNGHYFRPLVALGCVTALLAFGGVLGHASAAPTAKKCKPRIASVQTAVDRTDPRVPVPRSTVVAKNCRGKIHRVELQMINYYDGDAHDAQTEEFSTRLRERNRTFSRSFILSNTGGLFGYHLECGDPADEWYTMALAYNRAGSVILRKASTVMNGTAC